MKLKYPLKGIGKIPGVYQTQSFGGHLLDYSQFGMIGHNGIDWAAPLGAPVLAAHTGRVAFNPNDPDGYGIYARVYWEEDGFTFDTVYGHFQKVNGINRQVQAGEVIGYVDSTGFSTGNHLHFGVRKLLNGAVIDYQNGYLGYFNPQPFFYSPFPAIVYKKKNDPTLYFLEGQILIGYATDYNTFKAEFGDAKIIELEEAEFIKFKIAKLVVKI